MRVRDPWNMGATRLEPYCLRKILIRKEFFGFLNLFAPLLHRSTVGDFVCIFKTKKALLGQHKTVPKSTFSSPKHTSNENSCLRSGFLFLAPTLSILVCSDGKQWRQVHMAPCMIFCCKSYMTNVSAKSFMSNFICWVNYIS